MTQKGKELATQQTLCKNLSPSNKANFQDSREPDKQEIAETPANDTTECLSETQTKVTVEPAENDKGSVGDLAVDPVGGHGENSTGGAQLQPQQNRGLTGGMQLQSQQDINAIEVNVPKVPDLHIVEVVADSTTTNRADNLSNSDSDSEMRAHVAYLKKKKKKS